MSYQDTFGTSYPSVEIHIVYFTAPAVWARREEK